MTCRPCPVQPDGVSNVPCWQVPDFPETWQSPRCLDLSGPFRIFCPVAASVQNAASVWVAGAWKRTALFGVKRQLCVFVQLLFSIFQSLCPCGNVRSERVSREGVAGGRPRGLLARNACPVCPASLTTLSDGLSARTAVRHCFMPRNPRAGKKAGAFGKRRPSLFGERVRCWRRGFGRSPAGDRGERASEGGF